MRIDAPPATPPARLPLIDAARGVAMLAMIVYHFSWDLRFFGFISADVGGDLGWRIFARTIAGTFLALVGIGLVLSTRHGFNRARYLRRLGVIVAAAAAITLATWLVFPDNFIFFGILHQIALSSVLGLAFVRAPVVVVVMAALFCFLAPTLFAGPLFDHPALLWLGLASYFPRSNDFVPLFPWFGIVLIGIAAARLAPVLGENWGWLRGLIARPAPWPLIWAGRNSLAIYLLHQPILLGLVYLAAQIAPPDMLAFEADYLESCVVSCVESDTEADVCRRACACVADRAQDEDLWASLMRNTLDTEQTARYFSIAEECRATAEGEASGGTGQ